MEPVNGDPMNILHRKLKRLKVVLRAFNQSHFGGISRKVDEKRKVLSNVQLAVLNNPFDARIIELEKSLSLELYDLMMQRKVISRKNPRLTGFVKDIKIPNFFKKW